MSYSQITLDNLAMQLANSLDDPSEVYWSRLEKYYAISEAMRVWGAYTSYWRERGVFNLTAGQPYYDVSSLLPALRARTATLQTMVQEIQFHCLEAPNGIGGAGMSSQLNVQSIVQAVVRARQRYCIDSQLPLKIANVAGPATPDGIVVLPQTTVYVHRVGWQDSTSGRWTNLYRQDEWAYDKGQPQWMLEPSTPSSFSEAFNSPLNMQLYPLPNNQGTVEVVTADTQTIDQLNPAAPMGFPDEWVHGIKYAALNDIFGSGMIYDPVRADYCETRYKQAVEGVKNAQSIARLIVNNNQVPIDTFKAIDSGYPYWRNQSGYPQIGGVMHDILTVAPVPDNAYGAAVDLVRSAPIPISGTDFLQIGQEEMANLIDYCVNYLMLKCGGKDMQDTFGQYDSFMSKVDQRKSVNDVKIIYLNALLNQPTKEEDERPTMSRPKVKQPQ